MKNPNGNKKYSCGCSKDIGINPVTEVTTVGQDLQRVQKELKFHETKLNFYQKNVDEQKELTKQAKHSAEYVERVFDEAIQQQGNVEVIDARGGLPSLASRLENVDTHLHDVSEQLVDKSLFMRSGIIKIPNDFPSIPFNITRKGLREYVHNVTPYNLHDWSDAIEIFVSHAGASSSSDGTNVNLPITLGNFKVKYSEGVYGSNKKFIISFLSNVFYSSAVADFSDMDIDILFRSQSISGFTWICPSRSGSETTYNWSLDSGVYKTTLGASAVVFDVINFKKVDEYGIPFPYSKVSTLDLCKTKKGSFYQDGVNVYVNPHIGEYAEQLLLNFDKVLITINGNTGNFMFENIGLPSNAFRINPTRESNPSTIAIFNCKFYRGLQDALAISGNYNAYVFDSVASYGSKDGFNYHSRTVNSLAVEVNCVSYGNGKYKIDGGNTTTNSNNASTGHDGMKILRVGGRYWECEGPIVADLDCYSISLGCEAYDVLSSTTGEKVGFFMSGANTKYVVECLVSGKDFKHSVRGASSSIDLKVLNIESVLPQLNTLALSSWEDVAQ